MTKASLEQKSGERILSLEQELSQLRKHSQNQIQNLIADKQEKNSQLSKLMAQTLMNQGLDALDIQDAQTAIDRLGE